MLGYELFLNMALSEPQYSFILKKAIQRYCVDHHVRWGLNARPNDVLQFFVTVHLAV